MTAELLVQEFDRILDSPDALSRLRPFFVELALRGEFTGSMHGISAEDAISYEDIVTGMKSLLKTRPRYRWKMATTLTKASAEAPAGWCAATLNDTGLYVNGLGFKAGEWRTSGRPIIRIQNLSGSSNEYNFTDGEYPPDNVAQNGDILVSWSATLDAFMWRGPEGVINQHIFKVIPNPAAVVKEYLYWLLKHEVRQLAQSQYAHGLAMLHINRGPFLSHAVLLPPLVEQERIVGKLQELMCLCDELEAIQTERERRRDNLRGAHAKRLSALPEHEDAARMDIQLFLAQSGQLVTKPQHVAMVRQVILDLAVQGRLVRQESSDTPHRCGRKTTPERSAEQGVATLPFQVPESWGVARVRQTLEVGRDISYGVIKLGPEPREGGIPTLRCSDVKPRHLSLAAVRTVDPAIEQEYTRTRLKGGELVINIRGTLGGVARIPPELAGYNVAREVAVVPIATDLDGDFLVNVMASTYFWEMIQESLRGIAYVGLNLRTLRELPLPIPPLEEQRRIASKVTELICVCDELEGSLARSETDRMRLLDGLLREVLKEELEEVEALQS